MAEDTFVDAGMRSGTIPRSAGSTCRASASLGRTFIGTLTTKTLLIAGEGGVHTNEAGKRVALLRAYDKLTGADIGAVEIAQQADRLTHDLRD